MKTALVLPLWIVTAVMTAGMLTGCASQSEADRPAARQRAAEPAKTASHAASQEAQPSSMQVVRAAAPAEQEAGGDVEAGKETFEQCAICHNIDSDEAKMGPSLKGLFKKEKLHNGKAASEENIRAVINEGGNGMPGYEDLLEADEMKNLMAYLRTI